jgi:hypothetical protein
MRSMPLMVYLVGATLLQALHACLIFLIRPFSQIKDNIIEVANELTLTTLMALIIFFNDESAWSKTPILIFLYFHYLLNHIGISYCSPLSLFCSFRSVSPEHLNPYAHFIVLGDLGIKATKFVLSKNNGRNAIESKRETLAVSNCYLMQYSNHMLCLYSSND